MPTWAMYMTEGHTWISDFSGLVSLGYWHLLGHIFNKSVSADASNTSPMGLPCPNSHQAQFKYKLQLHKTVTCTYTHLAGRSSHCTSTFLDRYKSSLIFMCFLNSVGIKGFLGIALALMLTSWFSHLYLFLARHVTNLVTYNFHTQVSP